MNNISRRFEIKYLSLHRCGANLSPISDHDTFEEAEKKFEEIVAENLKNNKNKQLVIVDYGLTDEEGVKVVKINIDDKP